MREKIGEADEMIKTLDDCIDELKTGTAVFQRYTVPILLFSGARRVFKSRRTLSRTDSS